MIEKNVKVVDSSGEECFICERSIDSYERAIRVSFMVNLLITRTEVRKEMHIQCAAELHSLLGRRINQAKGGKANGR